ncbi:hypothetical protein HDU83_002831 [Entophlyctis luteolus]|nr:hypothetical protein HDU83_002831 [Entophlyctis luteolus]
MKLAPALIAFLVISISSVRAAALAQRTGAYTAPIAGALALTIRSSVDVFKDGKVEIIANDRGQRVAPSHVGFVREELRVGHVAKNQAPMNLAVLSMCLATNGGTKILAAKILIMFWLTTLLEAFKQKDQRRAAQTTLIQWRRSGAKPNRPSERSRVKCLSRWRSSRSMIGSDLSEMLTRAQFERLAASLCPKTFRTLQSVMIHSGPGKNEIDEILLVGGFTRVPMKSSRGLDPDEAVVDGAANYEINAPQ